LIHCAIPALDEEVETARVRDWNWAWERERERVRVCVRVCVCVCVCEIEGQSVSEWVPIESPPVKGEWPLVARSLFLLKRMPHFKTCKSLVKKNMAMGTYGTHNQELLCLLMPTAI
jgi:hypothetical protein